MTLLLPRQNSNCCCLALVLVLDPCYMSCLVNFQKCFFKQVHNKGYNNPQNVLSAYGQLTFVCNAIKMQCFINIL